MLEEQQTDIITEYHLSEAELRQLHRHFSHPSLKKLSDLLTKANEEFNSVILAKITKLCY